MVREGLPFALAEMLRTVQPEQVSVMRVSRRCLQQTYFTELW